MMGTHFLPNKVLVSLHAKMKGNLLRAYIYMYVYIYTRNKKRLTDEGNMPKYFK